MGNTADDFWSMIWEQDVTLIVMLTRLADNEMVSLKKYFYKIWLHYSVSAITIKI